MPTEKAELYAAAAQRFRAVCGLREDWEYAPEVIAQNLSRYLGALAEQGGIQPSTLTWTISALKAMEGPGFAVLEKHPEYSARRGKWLRDVNARARAPRKSELITSDLLVRLVNARAHAGGMALAVQRDMALAMVSYFAAGRQSEISNLRLCDVDESPVGFTLKIRILKRRGIAEFRDVHIPRGTGEPTLPFLALRMWLNARRAATPAPPDDAPIFVRVWQTRTNNLGSIDGSKTGLSATAVNTIWRKMLSAAGLSGAEVRKFSAHGARSGRATDAARAGGSAIIVAQLGGWRDLETMARRYIDPAAKRDFLREEQDNPAMRHLLYGEEEAQVSAPVALQEKMAAAG